MYEVNEDTLAIVPISETTSRVIEKDREFIIEQTPKEIIDYSCLYFGSSYEGRLEWTKHLLGISYKSPIIVEETKNLIFFPTASPRILSCAWLALKNVVNYNKKNDKCLILFENKKKLLLGISYNSFDNQILRAARLDSVMRNKKKIG